MSAAQKNELDKVFSSCTTGYNTYSWSSSKDVSPLELSTNLWSVSFALTLQAPSEFGRH